MGEVYSKGDYAVLPTNDTDLENTFSAGEITAVGADDESYASQSHNDLFGIFQFRNTNANSTGTFSISWNGKVEVAGSDQAVYLALYNQAASSWETKASNNTIGTNTDFNFTAEITADASNYYNTASEVVWRIYQSAPLVAQMRFFENLPGEDAGFVAYSNGTLSFQAVNIPNSLSFVCPVVLVSGASAASTSRSYNHTIHFGLYTMTGSTLTLVNSASGVFTKVGTNASTQWISMATSTTSNITPGLYYFAVNILSGGGSSVMAILGNSSINPDNAQPVMVMARVTASTNAMPANIETSKLDITGSDAIKQPYIIITS